MAVKFEALEKIIGIPNVRITNFEQTEKEIHIHIEFTNERTRCVHCPAECTTIHERKEKKEVRDIQILGKKTFLHFVHRRFYCRSCDKTFMERFSWLDAYGRYTQRFADWLKEYGLKMDLKSLAKIQDVGYSTVERIMKNHTHKYLFPDKQGFPAHAGIDEFSQKKGRNTFCVIITNNNKRKPFDILPSRTKEDLEVYFKSIPRAVREKNKSFTVDMYGLFIKLIEIYFPNTEIIIDRFHVAKCLNKCINKTRRRLQKIISKERSAKLKNLRWIILKNNNDLTQEEKEKLQFAFECSTGIKDMYELKENIRNIFEKRIPKEQAKKELRTLLDNAKIKITDPSIRSFIKTYNRHEAYILNYFNERKSNGLVEGINNKIKVIKRVAYGMSNFFNFARKILASFSCNHSQV